MRLSFTFACALLLCACKVSTSKAPQAPTATTITAPAEVREAVRCTKSDRAVECFETAMRAEQEGELKRAHRFYTAGCDGGNPRACGAVGRFLLAASPPDRPGALRALEKACEQSEPDYQGCFLLATTLVSEPAEREKALSTFLRLCNDAPAGTLSIDSCAWSIELKHSEPTKPLTDALFTMTYVACDTDGFTDENRARRAHACVLSGTQLRRKRSAAAALSATRMFARACKLGSAEGCKLRNAVPKPAP